MGQPGRDFSLYIIIGLSRANTVALFALSVAATLVVAMFKYPNSIFARTLWPHRDDITPEVAAETGPAPLSRTIYAVAALAIVAAALLSMARFWLFDESIYHMSSLASSPIAFQLMQVAKLRAGELMPMQWLASWLAGGPAHAGVPVFNPLMLMLAPLNTFGQMMAGYEILLKVIGGAGVFLLLCRFDWRAATIAAMWMSFNGVHLAAGQDNCYSQPLFLLPWALLAIDRLILRLDGVSLAVTAIVMTVICLMAATVSYLAFCFMFMLPILAVRFLPPGDWKRALPVLMAAGALHAGMVAFEMVPQYLTLSGGIRNAEGNSTVRQFILLGLGLAAASVALAWAMTQARPWPRRIAAALWLGSLVLWQPATFHNVAIPTAPLMMVWEAYMGPAVGPADLISYQQPLRYLVSASGVLLLLLAMRRISCHRLPLSIVAPLALSAAFFLVPTLSGFSQTYYDRVMMIPMIGIVLALGLGAVDLFAWLDRRLSVSGAAVAATAIALVVIGDVGFVAFKRTIYSDGLKFLDARRTPETRFLAELGLAHRTMDVHQDGDYSDWRRELSRPSYIRHIMPMYYGASTFSIVGMSSIPSYASAYYYRAVPQFYGPPPAAPRNPLLDLAAVEYILSVPPLTDPALELVLSGEGSHIYRNTLAMPRVWVTGQVRTVPDEVALAAMEAGEGRRVAYVPPGTYGLPEEATGQVGSARISALSDEEIVIDCDLRQAGLLVVADLFTPNWKATVDGVPATILRTDVTFRGLALPAGRHHVVMRHQPPWRWPVLAVSMAAFVLTLGLAFRRVPLSLDTAGGAR
jgi:hypothetical protein